VNLNQSEWLREAFLELESSIEHVAVLVSPSAPYLCISGSGNTGDTKVEYPKDASVFDAFQCYDVVEHDYSFSLIKLCLKAMSVSSKTSLRINEQGLLSLQVSILFQKKFGFLELIEGFFLSLWLSLKGTSLPFLNLW
jgi:cell cycle checkpoint protein